MGGHSLGGVMAARYAAKHPEALDAVVLLASYSTSDLRDTGLQILSVYGTEDRVLKRNQYESCRDNLPEDFTERVIEGGCHAWFGSYGPQRGDGTPTISAEEQEAAAAAMIAEFLIPSG